MSELPTYPPAITPETQPFWDATAQGRIDGNRALLEINLTGGGVFDSPQPPVSNAPNGWIELEFNGCRSARLIYNVAQAGLEGEIRLQRITDDKVSLCEALGTP